MDLSIVKFSAFTAAHQQGHDGFLRMQAIFGLVKDDAVFAVDHIGSDFLAAVRRQAVQEDAVLLGDGKALVVDLVALKGFLALLCFTRSLSSRSQPKVRS